jgi:hypothetical protein
LRTVGSAPDVAALRVELAAGRVDRSEPAPDPVLAAAF